MNGELLSNRGLTNKGEGNILIKKNELTAGIYLYSLIIDGQEVDTKKMILTK